MRPTGMQGLRALANVSKRAAQRDFGHPSFVAFAIVPIAVIYRTWPQFYLCCAS
jgi:hypothetical protein